VVAEGEIEVAVLGPVEVRGAAKFARAPAFELVVYLALHPSGVLNDTWATALWPDRLMASATLHSTASAARRALGRDRAGNDHLPRAHGRLQLGPGVRCDWQRFQVLAASSESSRWDQALALVRGRAFDGLRSVEWTVLEGIAAEVEERVAEVACRAADTHLERAAPTDAVAAARRGLLVSPYDERLYRRLLVCADALGHPAGVERVMAELLGRIHGTDSGTDGPFDLAAVHPKTAALYAALSRRPGHEPGGASLRQ
jgi:DNA-binding SARP family transcriptional activator